MREVTEDVLDKGSLRTIIPTYIERCKHITEEQRQREIKNNELVADAYGVRNEVPCDVPIERVSLKRNPAFAYPKNTPAERDELMTRDIVKEIVSYAVGCMFGRYSLDKPGLILASQGETLADYHAQIPNPSFEPDSDNVIPVTEDEWFEDDIVARFRQFLSVALGEQHLEENIAYIEQVLGKSLRKYFVNDFYDDHVKMYKNRPIYWMYSSRTDKKGAFKALVCTATRRPPPTTCCRTFATSPPSFMPSPNGSRNPTRPARFARAKSCKPSSRNAPTTSATSSTRSPPATSPSTSMTAS